MKKYNCYSYPMMQFLLDKGIVPSLVTIHYTTGKTMWIYDMNDELSKQLTVWSSRKPVKK